MNNLSFVGTTHLDINYSISNLVYSTSNILESHIYNTSNILESHISDAKTYNINYTNILRSNVNKWINEEVEHITTPTVIDKTHTYIYNSNLSGEIRFFCKSTPLFPPQIPGDYPAHRVKIDADGKLKLYYTYDSTINLTWLNGWVDIVNLAVSLVASDTNLGASIGAVQLEVGTLNQKVDFEVERIYNALAVIEAGDLEQDLESLNEYRAASRNAADNPTATMNINSAYTNIRNLISTRNTTYLSRIQNSLTAAILQNPITAFVTGAGGAVLGIIYGIAQGVSFDGFLNSLTKEIDSNSNLTPTEKTNLKNYITDDLMVKNAINIASLEYNKGLGQGFINCNIATAQTIPNIKTSNLTINNTGSATYSLINFSNATNNSAGYVGLGGIVSGYHNNNMIYNTPAGHVFNIPGQNSLSVPAFAINSVGNASVGFNPSAYPLYRFTVAGDIYTSGAVRTNSIIYNSQELSTSLSYYLLKSGGTLTGPLTLNTGLYADPGPYPNGYNGDRIILNAGIGTNGYPYSVGINTDVFWHSAPSTASYKFYSGATNTATLNNAGLLTLPSINATTSIIINSTSASSLLQLSSTNTSGTSAIRFQNNITGNYAFIGYGGTVVSGNYASNLFIEASSNAASIIFNTGSNVSANVPRMIIKNTGNIGINILSPYTLFHMKGTNPALTIMGQGGAGATSTINLSTYDTTTNAPNCSLIATDTGDFGATFQIKQKLATADTNAQFTSFIIDKDGNAAFGNAVYANTKLYVNGKTRFEDIVTYTTGNWNTSRDGVYRTYYGSNSTSYYSCGNDANLYAHYFMKDSSRGYGAIMIMKNDGNTDMYGNVMIKATTPYLNIQSSSEGDKSIIYLGTPYTPSSALKCAIIAEGINSWSRSKLHFCLDNTGDNSTTYNASVANARMSINCDGTTQIYGLTRSRHYYNYGEILSYRASFDGTNGGGWYWVTNGFFQDLGGVNSYLCVAIQCLGLSAVWFGRFYLSGGGSFYGIVCDYRSPNGGGNTIDVYDVWNGSGGNAIKITIQNAVYGGNFNIKVSG
jgi:hypothetical protein